MALNPNQFTQIPVAGQVDLLYGSNNVVGAAVSASASGSQYPIVAGQGVKIENSLGGVPKILPLTSATDPVFGFVVFDIKNINRLQGQNLSLARPGTLIYLPASGAIARGANVQYNYLTGNVEPAGGVNPTCGLAYDEAVNSGDLIRVEVQSPRTSSGTSNLEIEVVATLAQINAGLVIIPGVAGKQIIVNSYIARVAGNFATGTSVELESTNASPVAVTTIAEAGLTTGAVLTQNSANTTLGAGFGVPLGSGDGLQVVNNGSAQTGGTSITFTISYSMV